MKNIIRNITLFIIGLFLGWITAILLKMKMKPEDVKPEELEDIKKDARVKPTLETIGSFKKQACKPCNRKLNKFIVKLLIKRDENLIEEFVNEKLCDDCKKLIK